MLKKTILLITSLLALSFIACSNTNIQEIEVVSKPNISLQNTYWKAISLYDKDVKTLEKEANINFNKNGTIHGILGCNRFFGNFKINKDNIKFEKLATTRMMCQDMQTENSFLKVLQNTQKYKIKGKTLNFFDDENNNISTFKAVYF